MHNDRASAGHAPFNRVMRGAYLTTAEVRQTNSTPAIDSSQSYAHSKIGAWAGPGDWSTTLHAFDVSRSNHPVRSRRSRQRLGLYGPSRLGSSASINSTSSGDKISFGS
jgi:hypothetical protein